MPPKVVESGGIGANASGPSLYSRGYPVGSSRLNHLLGDSLSLQLGVPARGSVFEHGQLVQCAASRPKPGNAGDRIPTLAAVQGPPHAVQFADTRYAALRITARHTLREIECREKWLRVDELTNMQDDRSHYLAVVQWIERVPPKRQIQVRFLSAGPNERFFDV